jgi:hypothetical protein
MNISLHMFEIESSFFKLFKVKTKLVKCLKAKENINFSFVN